MDIVEGAWGLIVDAGTVTAAVLAWLAIRRGDKAGQRALANIARERRLDFELDLLKDLIDDWVIRPGDPGAATLGRARLAMLPEEGLRVTRLVFNMRGPDDVVLLEADLEGRPAYHQIHRARFKDDGDTVYDRVAKELREATLTRVRERDNEEGRPSRWRRWALLWRSQA